MSCHGDECLFAIGGVTIIDPEEDGGMMVEGGGGDLCMDHKLALVLSRL